VHGVQEQLLRLLTIFPGHRSSFIPPSPSDVMPFYLLCAGKGIVRPFTKRAAPLTIWGGRGISESGISFCVTADCRWVRETSGVGQTQESRRLPKSDRTRKVSGTYFRQRRLPGHVFRRKEVPDTFATRYADRLRSPKHHSMRMISSVSSCSTNGACFGRGLAT
jgi:hypothetical protein